MSTTSLNSWFCFTVPLSARYRREVVPPSAELTALPHATLRSDTFDVSTVGRPQCFPFSGSRGGQCTRVRRHKSHRHTLKKIAAHVTEHSFRSYEEQRNEATNQKLQTSLRVSLLSSGCKIRTSLYCLFHSRFFLFFIFCKGNPWGTLPVGQEDTKGTTQGLPTTPSMRVLQSVPKGVTDWVLLRFTRAWKEKMEIYKFILGNNSTTLFHKFDNNVFWYPSMQLSIHYEHNCCEFQYINLSFHSPFVLVSLFLLPTTHFPHTPVGAVSPKRGRWVATFYTNSFLFSYLRCVNKNMIRLLSLKA